MYKIVDGTYDLLPNECMNLFALSDRLLDTFVSRGYKRIETPIIEKYELFNNKECNADINKMFKLTDYDGSLLVMRPDMTMPIARVATTKMRDASNAKFCYVSKLFSFDKGSSNDLREFTQAGIETFATTHPYVDADVIALAIETLLDAGLTEFQIEIGHVGYFKGLLNSLALCDEKANELMRLVNSKDTIGLELFQKDDPANVAWTSISNLPLQFGEIAGLAKLINKELNNESVSAINNLLSINQYLVDMGYGKYITYDLGLVNGVGYYSGVVFKGITKHFGKPILSGGRYDKLCDAFNKSMDATGFAIGVDHLLTAIRRCSELYFYQPKVQALIGGCYEHCAIINQVFKEALESGIIVENTYIDNYDKLKEVSVLRGIDKIIFVDKDGVVK